MMGATTPYPPASAAVRICTVLLDSSEDFVIDIFPLISSWGKLLVEWRESYLEYSGVLYSRFPIIFAVYFPIMQSGGVGWPMEKQTELAVCGRDEARSMGGVW